VGEGRSPHELGVWSKRLVAIDLEIDAYVMMWVVGRLRNIEYASG
jgi:hypothetical protein